MARTGSGGATGGSTGSEPVVQQIAFLAALIAIGAGWPLVRRLIPPRDTFAMIDLVREHWAHRHSLEPWLDERWAWLALHNYHLWFALAALPASSPPAWCRRSTARRRGRSSMHRSDG